MARQPRHFGQPLDIIQHPIEVFFGLQRDHLIAAASVRAIAEFVKQLPAELFRDGANHERNRRAEQNLARGLPNRNTI
jgi:hypothetical protein